MDDLLNEFLTETAESIDVVDVELIKLEQDPNNKGVLDNIFRLVHTIKGTCGFLGLPRLERVAHASENLLGMFRDGTLEVTPDAVTLILESLDRIKEILGGLAETEAEPEGDDGELIGRLDAFANGEKAPSVVEPEPVVEAAPEPEEETSSGGGEVTLDELEAAFQNAKGPEELAAEAEAAAAALEAEQEQQAEEVAEPVAETPKSEEQTPAKAGTPAAEAKGETQLANQSIRVNVDLLEDLMNMVSELVLTRNQLMQILRRQGESEFAVPLQRLSQCTTELQEGVMKTRMQPIGNAWAKLPRIVRDLCQDLGKKIDLQMKGAETELDRQVLELIKDPLTHMVRNSADHGVEMPADRAAKGKAETGTIRLNAFHEGGHIIIEITDDGAGLSATKLKKKVLANGLATEAELEDMTDQQIQKFIFHAGFSTAEKVTNVSGRGVGMDVVRSNIEKIGGTIDLKSIEGRGTSFMIKIPLTLAIVSALVVKCGSERFAIPQINVLELVRASQNAENTIEYINTTPVLRLRDRLLPLITLRDVLGLGSGAEEGDEAGHELEESTDDFIIVTQVGQFTFGIIVDQVFDTEEIVVKPVAPVLRDLSVYSGNTILGDGSVIMILDPNGIASEAGDAMTESDMSAADDKPAQSHDNEKEAMLVFKGGNDIQRAVPLSLIARLEEIDVEKIEHSDGRIVVQYRDNLMPLVMTDGSLVVREKGRQPVLVFSDRERNMGLVVDSIIDIVEEHVVVELGSDDPGILGTGVVSGKATEIIDVSYYIGKAFKGTQSPVSTGAQTDKTNHRRVLLVDDSAFFRNMLRPLLSTAGYKVTSVETAEEAIRLRDDGAEFDVIISDIEMPGIDGFEFARKVREGGIWQDTPLVALSGLTRPQDMKRGREAGFNDYVVKYDRDALLTSLSSQLIYEGVAA
jgi:two-component system chemotaxis sensor kinase CheA